MVIEGKLFKTNQLSNELISKICMFKDTFWIFGIVSQKEWFKKYTNNNNFHYIIFDNLNIIGYGLRRIINNYSIIDNILVNKNYRNMGFGTKIIDNLLKKTDDVIFLLCEENNIKFYELNGFNVTNINFIDKNISNLTVMSMNFDETKIVKIKYYN